MAGSTWSLRVSTTRSATLDSGHTVSAVCRSRSSANVGGAVYGWPSSPGSE